MFLFHLSLDPGTSMYCHLISPRLAVQRKSRIPAKRGELKVTVPDPEEGGWPTAKVLQGPSRPFWGKNIFPIVDFVSTTGFW